MAKADLVFLHDSIANRAEQAAERDDKGMLKKITPLSVTGSGSVYSCRHGLLP